MCYAATGLNLGVSSHFVIARIAEDAGDLAWFRRMKVDGRCLCEVHGLFHALKLLALIQLPIAHGARLIVN